MSGPGAVFGRPSHSKIRATYGGTEHNISHIAAEVTLNISSDSRRNQKETTADLRNRVVQYEIAEKEACKVMRTICQDASTMFGVSWNDGDIQDLLSGVLVLGNLCKRIGYEKNEAMARAEELRKQMSDLEKNKSDNISQLEQVILKLQHEHMRQSDLLAEQNLKHNHQVKTLSKEAYSLRELINGLKLENESLQTKLQFQERRLMEIPRLEEQYQRNARNMVRQQEQANTVQKIEYKKVEEEVKSLNYYRNRCKMLEENIDKLKKENDSIHAEHRLTHSKYQSLLSEFNRYKAAKQYNSEKQKRSSSTTRPSSAPLHRNDSSHQFGDSKPRNSVSYNNLMRDTNKTTTTTTATTGASGEEKVKSFEEINAEELMKLRLEVQKKDKQIKLLSRKLSMARAYPLRSTQDDDDEYELAFKRAMSSNNQTSNNANAMKAMTAEEEENKALLARPDIHYLTGNLSLENYMQEELESVSSAFLAEEDALQEARLLRAVDLQQEYTEKFASNRKADPPHITAIRKAKSFVKGLNL